MESACEKFKAKLDKWKDDPSFHREQLAIEQGEAMAARGLLAYAYQTLNMAKVFVPEYTGNGEFARDDVEDCLKAYVKGDPDPYFDEQRDDRP